MDRENSSINSLLEQTASIVRRSKIAAGTLEPTESYKRGQIEKLKPFANYNAIALLLAKLGHYPYRKLDDAL